MRRVVLSVLATSAIVAASLVTLAAPAGAEPGDLDGAFGVCGYLEHDSAVGVGTLADTTIAAQIDPLTAQSSRVRVWRIKASGAIDPTFGTNGVTTFDVIGRANGRPPVGMREDAFGRLLIPVTTSTQSTTLGYIARLLPDGTPDAGFSGGTSLIGLQAVGSIAPMADGSIFALMLDFSSAGFPIHISVDGSTATTLKLGGTERLVHGPIGTWADTVIAVEGGALTRWTLTGALDSAFTPVQSPTAPSDMSSEFGAIEISAAGALTTVSVAYSSEGFHRIVARFQKDGLPDSSFGTNGVTVIPGPSREPANLDLHVSPDGAVTTIADIEDATFTRYQVITRLTSTGELDGNYGDAGDSATPSWSRRGTSWTADATWYGAFVGEYDTLASVLIKTSNQPLKQGAGLVVGWNGDAWPTRFGTDPGPECPSDTPYWNDWDIARGITTVPGKGGYVGDGFGGIHPFSIGLQHPAPATVTSAPYWPGWDIARSIAALPTGGGYLLDGIGGIHSFATTGTPKPPRISNGPYWPGWDIARGIALMPDGASGYMVDGFGGTHPFSAPGHALPPRLRGLPYWPGWDIARGISILPDGTGGYVLDGFGGMHPFGIGTNPPPPRPGPNAPYAVGEDWARGFTFIAPIATGVPTITTANAKVGTAPTTGSTDARLATARRRGPTPAGPASP